MFYLILFVKTLKENIFLGSFFVIISGMLIFSLVGQKDVDKMIKNKIGQAQKLSYFYALISSKENYNDVSRKLRSLDEIKNIEIVSKEKIGKEVKRILGELDVEIFHSVWDMNYIALKVIFSKKVSVSAQNLIREYLTRLVGVNNLMLGGVKNYEKSTKKSTFILRMSKYAYPLFILIMIVVWSVIFLLLRSNLLQKSYIVEQYQRRKNVLLKTIFSGLIFLFVLLLVPACLLITPNYINLLGVVFLLIFSLLISLKKYAWES